MHDMIGFHTEHASNWVILLESFAKVDQEESPARQSLPILEAANRFLNNVSHEVWRHGEKAQIIQSRLCIPPMRGNSHRDLPLRLLPWPEPVESPSANASELTWIKLPKFGLGL